MEEHHRRAIDRLRERFADDPRFPALVVGGSIVKGLGRPDSDVDAVFVATDEEFERCRARGENIFLSGDFTDYPGGYVDGKIVNLQFLRDAAERGSEPARWAFVNGILVYSRDPEVAGLVERIPVYPRAEKQEKMRSFFCQVRLLHWFVGEAEKRDDRYLLLHAATELVLYAGRLVLADNEMLFPYHKWFMTEVRRAERKPDGFCELLDDLLARPCLDTARRVDESVAESYDPGLGLLEIQSRFVRDREWGWLDGAPALEDR